LATTIPVTTAPEQPRYYRLLAPWWHTLIVVGILLALSGFQAHRVDSLAQRHSHLPTYISTMAYEWIMVGIVWLGIHWRGIRLRDLVGGTWKSPTDFLLDVSIGLGFWISLLLVNAAVSFALGDVSLDSAKNMEHAKETWKTLGFLAPQGTLEIVFFAAVSATAGFCEELIFRGYLQKQFHAATRSPWAGIVLQSFLFGIAHGYQGIKRMVVIAALGLALGALAFWRRSLRPGMITHAWLDFSSGLLLRSLGRLVQ
jgi:membrane protease YdiL (CAAX protease family)